MYGGQAAKKEKFSEQVPGHFSWAGDELTFV